MEELPEVLFVIQSLDRSYIISADADDDGMEYVGAILRVEDSYPPKSLKFGAGATHPMDLTLSPLFSS